jgi:hypothetical protein
LFQDSIHSAVIVGGAVIIQSMAFRQEKRPAGITPPAFSCNCRLERSGSAAIPCLKFDLYSINKILTIDCEVHHG